jgi:hypothetical protein
MVPSIPQQQTGMPVQQMRQQQPPMQYNQQPPPPQSLPNQSATNISQQRSIVVQVNEYDDH